MASQRLVIRHLEKTSWKVLDDHGDIVKELIRDRPGVYALYRRDKLYYVGLTRNLGARLKTHLRDRHKRLWDRFSVYLTVHDEHMKELESLMLRIVAPPGNRVSGKFPRAENMQRDLISRIKEKQADELALLVGGRVARAHQRRKAVRNRGARAFAGTATRSRPLRGWDRDYEYRASLRRDGSIYYDGELYDSPTAASAAALGHRSNGWAFWKYRDEHGEWVPLRRLRK